MRFSKQSEWLSDLGKKKKIISEVYTIHIKYSGSSNIKYEAGGTGKSQFCINTFSGSLFSIILPQLSLVKGRGEKRD